MNTTKAITHPVTTAREYTRRLSRRGLIRLISLLTALTIAFAIMAGVYHHRNTVAQRRLEANYLRSLELLALNIDDIKTTLNKSVYAGSAQMLGDLSGELRSNAAGAKLALSQLPLSDQKLDNTNKFLSQVGNYSHSLAQRYARGDTLSKEDRNNIAALIEFSEKLSGELWEIEAQVSQGRLTFTEVFGAAHVAANAGSPEAPAHIGGNFAGLEDIFENYPSLNYDGPFSEHTLGAIEPRLLKGRSGVSAQDSLSRARELSGCDTLTFANELSGRIPVYVFRGCESGQSGNTTVTMTRDGGVFASMLTHRAVGEKAITLDKAITLAEEFIGQKFGTLGLENVSMAHTYYSLAGGVVIVEFASSVEVDCGEFGRCEVTVYPDLIRVGVAVDNGDIVSYDANEFITAHRTREVKEPLISESEARAELSALLEIQNTRFAIIPAIKANGGDEVLCYEFLCVSERGSQVLVYVNAHTGAEEQISLVRINDNGTIVV
ncbi:MAG: germination protein YpeB [Oscillospiraceae bacterium]|nr:germination protein YpeB [Oscillospiraceae bacterium]